MKAKLWRKLLVGFAVAAVAGGLLMSHSRFNMRSNADVPEGISFEAKTCTDGIYRGEATGFRPELVVEVVVEDGRVDSVSVVDHNEIGPQFWRRPVDLIPGEIVDEQSTAVDAVGGATATSHGIMAAVEDALNGAVG